MDGYNMTPADMRAVTDGARDDGFGMGGGWMWIIVLFLFIFGFGGGGMWGNRGQGLTQMEMQQGFDTQEIVRKLDGINYGLCQGFYAQNTTMLNGFAGVTTAVRDAQFAAQQCCCETNRNIDAVRYEAQKNVCDITTAIHAEGEATRALIQQNEMQALRDKVSELKLAQSQCAQNAYLTGTLRPYPVPAYPVCGPCGWNGGAWNHIQHLIGGGTRMPAP